MDSQKHQSPNKTTKHDDMLRQAIYNTGANVFVVLAGFGIVALYWVLESFFRPLMWAMLCGAFLHPFKCGVTKNVKSWLDSLKHSHTPFALGVLIAPFKIVDSCSESLVRSIQQRWRVIVLVLLVFTTLYVTYLQAPMDFKQFTACVWNTFSLLSDLISLFSFKWVFALIVGYLFMVVKYWSSENKKILSYLAFPIWIVTILCIISDAGALRLPLAFVVLMLIAIGAYTDYCSSQSSRRNSVTTTDAVHHDKSEPPISETIRSDDCEPDEHSLSAQWSNISNALFSSFSSSLIGPSGSSSEHLEVSVATNISEISNLISDEEKKPSHRDDSLADISQTEAIEEVSSSPREESVNHPSESQNEGNVSQTNTSPVRKKSTRRRSDKCFIFLFW